MTIHPLFSSDRFRSALYRPYGFSLRVFSSPHPEVGHDLDFRVVHQPMSFLAVDLDQCLCHDHDLDPCRVHDPDPFHAHGSAVGCGQDPLFRGISFVSPAFRVPAVHGGPFQRARVVRCPLVPVSLDLGAPFPVSVPSLDLFHVLARALYRVRVHALGDLGPVHDRDPYLFSNRFSLCFRTVIRHHELFSFDRHLRLTGVHLQAVWLHTRILMIHQQAEPELTPNVQDNIQTELETHKYNQMLIQNFFS